MVRLGSVLRVLGYVGVVVGCVSSSVGVGEAAPMTTDTSTHLQAVHVAAKPSTSSISLDTQKIVAQAQKLAQDAAKQASLAKQANNGSSSNMGGSSGGSNVVGSSGGSNMVGSSGGSNMVSKGSTNTSGGSTAPSNWYGGRANVPCAGAAITWPASIGQWTVPLGCYAGVFTANTSQFPSRPSPGWCNWWPEALSSASGSGGLHGPVDGSPHPGDVVHFNGGVQGASSEGHYAVVVAVDPHNPYWMLVSEENFTWRGAGFGKIDFRFVHTGSGVWFTKHV